MTDKEKLEQLKEELVNKYFKEWARQVTDEWESGAKLFFEELTAEILDWHEEQVAEERKKLGEILRQELEPNMAKYIIGRLEQSQEEK